MFPSVMSALRTGALAAAMLAFAAAPAVAQHGHGGGGHGGGGHAGGFHGGSFHGEQGGVVTQAAEGSGIKFRGIGLHIGLDARILLEDSGI